MNLSNPKIHHLLNSGTDLGWAYWETYWRYKVLTYSIWLKERYEKLDQAHIDRQKKKQPLNQKKCVWKIRLED